MITKAAVSSQSVACWRSDTYDTPWLYSCPLFWRPPPFGPFLRYERNSCNIDYDVLAKMRITASNKARHEQMIFSPLLCKSFLSGLLTKSLNC